MIGLLFFVIDIACKFGPHMVKFWSRAFAAARHPLETITWLVGPFHVKMHRFGCRVLRGARTCCRAGLADGDIIETIWRHLRRLRNILRSMGRENRRMLIELVIDRWNRRHNLCMPVTLVARLRACRAKAWEAAMRIATLKTAIEVKTEGVVDHPTCCDAAAAAVDYRSACNVGRGAAQQCNRQGQTLSSLAEPSRSIR